MAIEATWPRPDLEALTREFDALVERIQTPEAREAARVALEPHGAAVADAARLAAVRGDILVGLEELERGEDVDGETVLRELLDRLGAP